MLVGREMTIKWMFSTKLFELLLKTNFRKYWVLHKCWSLKTWARQLITLQSFSMVLEYTRIPNILSLKSTSDTFLRSFTLIKWFRLFNSTLTSISKTFGKGRTSGDVHSTLNLVPISPHWCKTDQVTITTSHSLTMLPFEAKTKQAFGLH